MAIQEPRAWKREFSARAAQGAFFALGHAAHSRDCSLIVEFIGALPSDLRWNFVKWVRAHSPIHLAWADGKIKGKVRRPTDPHFVSFQLEAAADALKLLIGQPSLLQLDGSYPDEPSARKQARKQFYLMLAELNNSNVRKKRKTPQPDFVSDLQHAEHTQLHSHFQDCMARLASDRPELAVPAAELLVAIQKEWKRRARNDDYFVWPRTDAKPGGTSLRKIASPELGILAALGYRVGKIRGQSRPVRLLVLDAVFSNTLPPINGPKYMAEWASPETPRRLHKMADCIATDIRNSKRVKSQDRSVAISQWSSDLKYLHDTYYAGRFRFAWPG